MRSLQEMDELGALHMTARVGDVEIAGLLLAAGADIDLHMVRLLHLCE